MANNETQSIDELLDELFTDYIVTPLSSVLFYDLFFWTSAESMPLIVAWLAMFSLGLTIYFKFVNCSAFGHAIDCVRGKYTNPDEHGEISHFQALSAALSATVGLGNIAGVAVAVGTGGPGAIFWMVIMGVLGMTSKFAECALGQKYKVTREEDGAISGGAFQYLSQGLKERGLEGLGRFLATLFACMSIGGSFGGGNMFQANQAYVQMSTIFPALGESYGPFIFRIGPFMFRVVIDGPIIFGIVIAVAVGVVILGGVKAIAKFAEALVPFMCGVYVVCGLLIVLLNFSKIPASVGIIVGHAFTGNAVYGSAIFILTKGVQRAAFSNEAGCGSAPIVHSAAKTDEPLREGLVALLEPFIDTVVVCSISGLVLVATDVYKLGEPCGPGSQRPEVPCPDGHLSGIQLTSQAFDSVFPGFRYLLSFIAMLFAFSTMVSWSYYGEQSAVYLFGVGCIKPYKFVFLFFTFLGCNIQAESVINFSDMMILGASFPNLLGVGLMLGVLKEMADDYFNRFNGGQMKRYESQGRRLSVPHTRASMGSQEML